MRGKRWGMSDVQRHGDQHHRTTDRPKEARNKTERTTNGLITTSPTEIDAIIRKTYGKIYAGNVRNQEEKTEQYLEKLEQRLHKDENKRTLRTSRGRT